MPQSFIKDPDAKKDYAVDWSDWLDEDTISTSTWEADDDGITVEDDPAPANTGTVTTVWLSGGTVGERYEITNHIVTSAGREDDRTIEIRVQER